MWSWDCRNKTTGTAEGSDVPVLNFKGVIMRKHAANIITACRICGSILLLAFPVFSAEFCITYLLCGFSDMVDGIVARVLRINSVFGSKLDTFADLLFTAVSMIKLLPKIEIPALIWIWIAVIASIKAVNIVVGFIKRRRFVCVHSIPNKIAGLMLFFLPLTLRWVELKHSAIFVCIIATLSAIYEGYCIVKERSK